MRDSARIRAYAPILLCFTVLLLVFSRPYGNLQRSALQQCVGQSSNHEVLNWNSCFISLHEAGPRHTVDLSGNKLSKLPEGFLAWTRDQVHTLYISDNSFDDIPDLSLLTNLRMLSIRRNKIRNVNCNALPPGLIHLILTDNAISSFSGDCTGRLSSLKKLMLTRNRLASLPDNLRLPELELIRLPQNRLRELPRTLIMNAKKLKWASFADNPCCPDPDSDIPFLGELECDTDRELGSGTSGVAILCKNSSLVFKKFKPNSSDGSVDSELKISLLLPKGHPCILAPLGTATLKGVISADGEKAYGVVFPHKNALPVGLPPSFGCEDRFPAPKQRRFTARRVLSAMRDAICGLADMHEAGVAHMDLYAHNTLLSESEVVFLDYGAATSMKGLTPDDANLLVMLDIRAFGNLIGNLVDFVVNDRNTDAASVAALEILKRKADAGTLPSTLCKEVRNEIT